MLPLTSLDFSLSIAFLIGLASTLHCVGMCGGIAGGLSASLPAAIRANRRQHTSYIIAYNTGRIASYTLAGAIVGGASSTLLFVFDAHDVHLFVHLLTALVLALIALYFMGVFPKFASLQYIGQPVWRYIEPWGRKLLPVKTIPQAFLYGAVWGWIPCGLVYSVLAWSLASGSAGYGAMIMLVFGLGTFPTLILTSLFSTWIFKFKQLPALRFVIGFALFGLAIYYLLAHEHAGHMPF